MLIKPKKKGWISGPAAYYKVAAGGGGPAYVARTGATANGSGAVLTSSIDIGTASADRLVIVAVSCQNTTSVTSVVVNSIFTLTQDAFNATGPTVGIFSGLVTSGSGPQTVTVTWSSGTFLTRNFFVWTATGLSSNVFKQIGTASGASANSINVTAGDLLFAADCVVSGTTTSFSSSTETPAGQRQIGGTGTNSMGCADWTVVSSNAAFSITDGTTTSNKAAATYR